MAERKDGFFKKATQFFNRVANQDLIRVGGSDGKVTALNQPASEEELKRRSEFSVFRQYLQQKNWSTRHSELYNEFRKMDENFPIINAALRLYAQEVCLSGDTILHTPSGEFSIKDLYYNKGKDKDLFYVHSFYQDHHKTSWGLASYIKKNGVKPVYEVVVEKNLDLDTLVLDPVEITPKFKCTDNHKIMLPDGSFKMLSELKPGDYIFTMYKYTDPSCSCKEDRFIKSRILSITSVGEEEVFDLINVYPYNHFSIKISKTMYAEVHNCSKDEDGNVIKVISDNKEIKEALEECFYRNLKLNSSGYLFVKEMLKFGNMFCWLNVRQGEGVLDMMYLPPEAIRIEMMSNAENLDDYKYIWSGTAGGGTKFEPWEIVHFRNIEDIEYQPYGTSILRSIVDTWRRIILMREALIIYRVTRAPQRYLFKIDTTGMDPEAALLYSEEVKKQLYKKPMVNPTTGEIDFKYNPLSIEENFYQPTFEGDVGGIEVLQGASNLSDVEDYKIIKDDLFAGLLIPKSYLTFEEDLCLRGNTKILTQEGVKTIKEIAESWTGEKKMFTLSCNKYGYITSGKILWAGVTKEVTELYAIEINGKQTVEATDNHPFMMDGLNYVRADELKIGDKLKGMFEKEYKVTNITVIALEEPEFVYDLTVDEYHNFALEAGVFVHNSNKAALAQEDMRFSGAVKQYQGNFIEGLLHVAIVHLHLQGFSTDDLNNFSIEMNTNSVLVEKLRNETLQQRVDLAKSILDVGNGELTLMSFTQVLKEVLKMSDEEIELTFKNQAIEKKIAWRFAQLKENGTYEEPQAEKKNAMLRRIGNDDVFSGLKFEAKELMPVVQNIISKKLDEEIKMLAKPVRLKPTKKQTSRILRLNEMEIARLKTLKDLGIREGGN